MAAGSRPRFDDINARVETLKPPRSGLPSVLPSFFPFRFTRIVRSRFRVVGTMKRQTATWYQLDRPPTVVYQAKSDRVQTWKLCEGGRAAFTPFPYKSHCCARRRTTDFYVQPVLILSSTPQFVQSPNERVESIQNSHRVSYVNYEAIDRGIYSRLKKKKMTR